MSNLKRFWPVGLACVLSACSLIPTYERPNAPIDSKWPHQCPCGNDSELRSTDKGWQGFFTDKTLCELIETALIHNRDWRVAVLNVEQARAQLGIRRADQFPSISAALTGSRTPDNDGAIKSAYAGGLTVTAYELDFFGRVASLKEQALAQYLASREGSTTARISLITTVAQAWLNLLADEDLLAISKQTLSSRESSLQLMELKLQHGAASELEVQVAQTLLQSARVTVAALQRQRLQDENALVLLLGQSLPETARAALTKGQLDTLHFADLPVGLPSEVLTSRPDIRQAEQLLIASNANIGAARAAFFPRISLTAGVGSASSELSQLFKDGSWGWTLAPQLLLPIFDAGRNQANLDMANTSKNIAVAQYEKAIQTAFREVSDALAGRETLSQQLQASEALLQSESKRSHLTQLRFDHGASSLLDSLDAQRSLFAAQQSLIQTRLAVLQNRIVFFKVLGGGV